ncbi:hypothetical protein B0A67_17635 [Flavobacterium aquidurense]|jgi:hypothetical protein|nr:hypothetical protein B0A67_17635 [Flavobacterium aquidurense]SHG14698.1 hypothetical protein SAMN05444481_102312 [Flavobacterium frigidimaris]
MLRTITIKKLKKLDLTQKLAIAIPILFILSCLTKSYIERFRFSDEFRWIYENGSFGTLILCIFLVVFSFANSILLIRDLKTKLLPKLLWILLSLSVFLYVAIALIITFFR